MSINISGPTDKWFGIGFGSTIMTNTYAIICSKDSNSKSICQENKLGPEGSTGYGQQLTPTINVLQDTTTSNIRRIYLTRNITINNINYFSFSTWTQTVNTIYAIGTSNSFTSNTIKMGPGGSTRLKIANRLDNNLTVTPTTLGTKIILNNIIIYPDQDIVQLNISGPSDVYFGIGFNSQLMDNTYAIICDITACHENQLIAHSYGNPLTITTKIISKTTQNNMTTIVFNRKRNITATDSIDYEKYFEFPDETMTIPIIYAIGSANTWSSNNPMSFEINSYNSVSIEFKKKAKDEIVAITPLFMNVHQSINIEIFPLINRVNITLIGPDNKWFGIGFNSTVMGNTYSIICSNEKLCFEQLLGDGNIGQRFRQQHINITSDIKSNGKRIIKLYRKQIITRNDDANYEYIFSFPSYAIKIPIIYAYGTNNIFITNQSHMANYKIAALQFSNKTNRFNMSANLNIFGSVGQSVNINVFPDDNNVEIVFTGPSDVWYGIGFNSSKMGNTYAIVVDTMHNAHEYILDEGKPGNRLKQQIINYQSNKIKNGLRTVKITRPLAMLDPTGYDFPVSNINLSIISAYGTQYPYNESTMQNATVTILPFEINPGNTPCQPGVKSYGTQGNVGNGFIIGLRIYCKNKTIQLSVDYTNYKPNWFGIVFNDKMEPSTNATVFTTGKPDQDQRPLGLYSYDLGGKVSSQVVYHKERDWTKLEQNIKDNTVSIIYSQNLTNTKWSIYTRSITFRYAYGTSSQGTKLEQHTVDDKSEIYTFNLVTGAISTADSNAIQTAHGIIMIVSWSLLTTIGIFSSRYRLVIYQKSRNKAMWFFVHRGVQCTVVVLVLIGFGIAIYFTQDNDNKHFSNPHECVGLTVVILAVLQPINAWFRPHPPGKNMSKSIGRLTWEIIHKSFGYITWIMAQIAIYLGIGQLSDKTIYKTVFIIWVIIVFCVFVLLYIYNSFCFMQRIVGSKNDALITNESGKTSNIVRNLSPGSAIGPAADYASDNDSR
eukprot:84031_1